MAKLANRKKANEAADKIVGTMRDSYEAVVDHVMSLQDRNVRFAQSMVETTAGEYRQQVEANRAVAQKLVERAEEQRDALQTVVEESLDAYIDLLYAPLSYYKEGLEVVRKATK